MLSTLSTNNSPFNEQQLGALKKSIGALDQAQSQWLSGYIAGRLESGASQNTAENALTTPVLTVLYGSETGNGEALAQKLGGQFEQTGLHVRIESLDRFRPAQLQKLERAVFIISTHGEGDPPEEAVDLFEYLFSERAPKLSKLEFRVLALGDRSYEHFCATGRELDERLQALGARPFGPRTECDVDFEADSESWLQEVVDHAKEHWGETISPALSTHLSLVPSKPRWTRQEPFEAEVLKLQKITGDQSEKDIYHLELDLEGSGLNYLPGDALGVWAPNDPATIEEILQSLKIDENTEVDINDNRLTVFNALKSHLEITRLTTETIEAYANAVGQVALQKTYQSLEPARQRQFLEQRQLADLAMEFPGELEAQTLVDLLRPLVPRSYSISSSQSLVDEEAHLTVATLQSDAVGKSRSGVASSFLNHRVDAGDQVRIFLEPNNRFHLPDDDKAPVIMIGAGTGIAPFRAFMQEIESAQTPRQSWLVFGNPHLRTDFLYQRDWLNWRSSGLMDQLDTAWSRDGDAKRYVQHVISEQAERLNEWLQNGAHIYICGGLAMGQAVHEALEEAIASQNETSTEEAGRTLSSLRKAGRIHKDLY